MSKDVMATTGDWPSLVGAVAPLGFGFKPLPYFLIFVMGQAGVRYRGMAIHAQTAPL